MDRPLAAEDTEAGRTAREIVMDSLTDAEPILPGVKRTARDLIEWQAERIARQSAEIQKLKGDLSASEASVASLESEDTDAMKARDALWTENHQNERLIKQFMEAALPSIEVSTTRPERAVEIVADMKRRLGGR